MKEILENVIILTRGMWRYHWQAMGLAWLLVLVGWIAVHYLSAPRFEANAQIYIDTESVLEPLLKGLTVEVDKNEQLGLIARQLLSWPNLEHVVQQIDFDREALSPVGVWPEKLNVEKLKENISVEAESTDRQARYHNFFTISYTNKNPQLAELVVQSLIDAFAANTIAEIQRDASRAKEFIDKQITGYREQLTISEKQLQEFKTKHFDVLPYENQGYFQRLQQEQAALAEVELQIRQAESRKRELQAQLQDTPRVVRAVSADGTPVLTSLESRITALRQKLDELRLKFTEGHPNVIEAKASLAELEAQQKKDGAYGSTMDNPMYQQLELAIKNVEGDLAAMQTRKETYSVRVETLKQQLETFTRVEEELQDLTDDYNSKKANYDDLVARRQSMAMSESVEQNRGDLQFRVIEPPKVALDSTMNSTWIKQLVLITGVLIAGVGGGVTLAYALSQIRPVIYSQRTLSELTGLPVFAVISEVPKLSTRARRWLDLTTFAATGLMMVLAFGVTLYLHRVQLSSTDPMLDTDEVLVSQDANLPGSEDGTSPGSENE